MVGAEGCKKENQFSNKMSIPREEQLQKFVAMYGQLAVEAIESYNKGKDPYIILADASDDVPVAPDMKLIMLSEKDLGSLNPTLVTVRMTLHQFRTCDKRQQSVMGIRFADGNLYTHVVQIAPRKKN